MLHEITHACLSHLPLPLWLEEGVAQLTEAALSGGMPFALNGEDAAGIRRYWREHGLRDFWWGTGFHSLDGGQRHSYRLAEILFRLIVGDHRRRLPDFVRHTQADDAGDGAAREFLGRSLADLAAQFLGPGSWDPVPPDCAAYCRRGVLYLSREQYDKAIADFDEGIRLDHRFPDAYTNRGLAHYRLCRYAAATADNEQAIRLNPKDYFAHNNLAWVLATCPDGEHRNGKRAMEHATKACELSGVAPWFCLGTLAAAYAEVGDFEEARTWAKGSLRLAPEDERAGCKERLKLYKEGRPYREVAKHSLKALGR
jgi:tetratricopeptide (TPR) repeat protein